MQNSDMLQHPIIEVIINGNVVEKSASAFKLATQAGFHSVVSRLLYPADSGIGKAGDAISVSLVTNDKTDLYFTGSIYSANIHNEYRELLLTDDYKKLCGTKFAAAYRKEKAANILEDILGASGISDKSVTCPDIEIARFSTMNIPAKICIELLIHALETHGEENFTYFFDEKNIFHFGLINDTGKNTGRRFETGKNILHTGPGWIEVLPQPIRHTQGVTIDGKAARTVRTDLLVSRKLSRLTLFAEAA
jgi:hypothetical protein